MRALNPVLLAAFFCVHLPTNGFADVKALSISECTELQTCDAAQNCVNQDTRVLIAQPMGAQDGAAYFSIGPLLQRAGGGLFHKQDWRWAVDGLAAPSKEKGRSYVLSLDTTGAMTAHVYRPGREVRGMGSSDWVRADYACTQVLF